MDWSSIHPDRDYGRAAIPRCAMTDVEIFPQGVVGFRPLSEAAKEWFTDNMASSDYQWLGPVLYVESRFADELTAGLAEAGLTWRRIRP